MITCKALKELLIYQELSKPENQTRSYFLELPTALNNAPYHRYLTKNDYINYSCITEKKKMVKPTFQNIMM